jgi:uncharacterized cupredoxin-like copper-binding protein
MNFRFGAALTVATLLAGACARHEPTASITITTTDFAFAAPDTIPAGLVTLRLINQGKELHHAVLVRLGEGKTVADFQAGMQQMMQHPGPPPPWISFPGGPNAVDAADTAIVTVTLDPGQYVLICVIPSADGVPHVAKGMMRPLVVAARAAVAAAEPTTDNVLTLSDYDFQLQQPLTAGAHVLRVENAGHQTHEVVLAELAPGKSVRDFVAWEMGGEKGPLPTGRWLGGVTGLDQGRRATWAVTLPPGRYLLLCFWPDVHDGKPHLVHGMAKELTVQNRTS